MRYDIVGALLVCTSAFLYATRYVAAAIFMSGVKSWNAALFQASYGYVGDGLTTWSIVALIAGLGSIGVGLVVSSRKQKREPETADV